MQGAKVSFKSFQGELGLEQQRYSYQNNLHQRRIRRISANLTGAFLISSGMVAQVSDKISQLWKVDTQSWWEKKTKEVMAGPNFQKRSTSAPTSFVSTLLIIVHSSVWSLVKEVCDLINELQTIDVSKLFSHLLLHQWELGSSYFLPQCKFISNMSVSGSISIETFWFTKI